MHQPKIHRYKARYDRYILKASNITAFYAGGGGGGALSLGAGAAVCPAYAW